MRIDFGLVLAIVLEYIFFIYYADTLFNRKRNKFLCYGIIAVGYAIHLVVCMFGNTVINTSTAFIVNFLGFILCYHIAAKTAAFQSFILIGLCAASEYLIIFMPYMGIIPSAPSSMTPAQSLILTLTSRTLYLIGLMISSHLFYNNRKSQSFPSWSLITIPILTISILLLIINTGVNSNLMSISSLLLMIINIIVFILNQKMVIKELEISALREQELNERINFEEYSLLKEENERMSILRHDYKEIINGLSIVIDPNNDKAKQYINQFYDMVNTASLTEYSDSKMLNVILSRMVNECNDNGISFSVDPIQAHMSFIRDMDIVVIFSNLINNALESCSQSKKKKVFLSVSTVNDNFIVIRLENSCDKKPFVVDGKLITHKRDTKGHGIGMNSITKAIRAYDGHLNWEYIADENVFVTTVVIKSKNIHAA